MRYPRFIIFIALLGAIIIGSVFTLSEYKDYLKYAKKLANQKAFLENQTQYYKEIEENFKKLETKRETVDKISSMLPKKLDTSSLVNYFNITSSQCGLVLNDISISSGKSLDKRERIKEHHITLKFSGTYSGLKNFLASIEKSARLFEVDKIVFSAPKEKEVYDFEIQLTVYSY